MRLIESLESSKRSEETNTASHSVPRPKDNDKTTRNEPP